MVHTLGTTIRALVPWKGTVYQMRGTSTAAEKQALETLRLELHAEADPAGIGELVERDGGELAIEGDPRATRTRHLNAALAIFLQEGRLVA